MDALDDGDGFRMEDLNFLLQSIKQCLKTVSDEQAHAWAVAMAKEEMTEEFISLVTEDDLRALGLGKYQAKALVKYWTPAESREEKQGEPAEPRQNVVNQPINPSTSLLHILDFSINWEKVHNMQHKNGPTAKEILESGRVPDPQLRCKIVGNIVEQVAKSVKEPSRASFGRVYELIMAKYPKSFEETLGRGTEVTGGLLLQMKTKFDNDYKRPERNVHLKDAESMLRRYENPIGKFSYGCVRWRAKHLPLGQTTETVQEQKQKLQKIFRETRSRHWNWEEISTMMQNTYKAQREMANKNSEDALTEQKSKRKRSHEPVEDVDDPPHKVTINDLYEEWPFLFSYRGMLVHYQELTNVDLEKELDIFINSKQEVLLKFFDDLQDENSEFYTKTLKDMKKARKKEQEDTQRKKGDGSHELRAISLMLPKYFGEAGFIEIVNETETLELLNGKGGPAYPGLAVPAKRQSLFKGKKFFLGVDSEFQYSLISFKRAISCVFMLYFVFNIDYAPESQITMEFLQRYVFNVDPPKGNKRPTKKDSRQQGKFSTKVVHPMVARLCTKLKLLEKKQVTVDSESDLDSDNTDVTADVLDL